MKQLIYILIISLALFACNKSEFLDKKPDQSLSEPKTIEEFQTILDNDAIMNGGSGGGSGIDPIFLMAGTDDYYMPEDILAQFTQEYRNLYIWNDNIYGLPFTNWNQVYKSVFYANTVLDGIADIEKSASNEDAYNLAQGSALFYRARFFYELAQIFAPQYDANTADTDWGIVLRLSADINENIKRSTVKETYEKIITDLKEAAELLPTTSSSPYKTRPSKPAAYAMLAKTYLTMQDYANAKQYADLCLALHPTLIDYNDLNPNDFFQITRTNPEIIFHSMLSTNFNIVIDAFFVGRIDTTLYKLYDDNDLRKTVFFQPVPAPLSPADVTYKGSYDGSYGYFTGIAADEIYLIKAEASARLNNVPEAIDALNTLMQKRWKNDGSWSPYSTALSQAQALTLILTERRKELVQRGTRWTDLRRLNQLGANISITRRLDGQSYVLQPADSRYTYLIPPDIISFHPDMPQNPR